MAECQIHLLTFVTKYSRAPSEEIALKRYDAMMDIGREPLVFDSLWSELIWNALKKQMQNIWIKVIAGNVLPDHAHMIIDSNNKGISEIVQKLKGYSAYLYNRSIQRSGPVRATWYSDTYLDNEKHLASAVEYVKNNHLKHQSKSHYMRWESL